MLYVICLVYIVYFSFFSTVAAYMANKVVDILTDSRRVEQAVLRMAELIAALLSIHGLLTFVTDVYTFLDLLSGTIALSITVAFDRSIIVLLNLPVYL